MPFALILLFAIAISIDGTAAGMAYGLRGIRIPWPSLLIIGISSALAVMLSVIGGSSLGGLLNPTVARVIGGLVLVFLGVLRCRDAKREDKGTGMVSGSDEIFSLRLRSLGVVIRVLRDPRSADLDSSGNINPHESLLLGAALALDAIGAGLAAGGSGFPPVSTGIISGTLSALFLNAGFRIGAYAGRNLNGNVRLVPGIALVILGLFKAAK